MSGTTSNPTHGKQTHGVPTPGDTAHGADTDSQSAGGKTPPPGFEDLRMHGDWTELGQTLRDFGIMEVNRFVEICKECGGDSRKLLDRLAADGILTKFQSDAVWKGGPSKIRLGNYLLLDKLGEGGMGEVFKARNRSLGRLEAIKTIRGEEGATGNLAQRFRKEAKLQALLEHPSFVPIYNSDRVNDVDFIAMRYVEGHTLKQLVDEAKEAGKKLPVSDAVRYIAEAAKALHHAHRNGVIHRDIKPSNLMVMPRGDLIVLDMGIARLVDPETGESADGMTVNSRGMGTPEYMPPEQWADARAVTPASDVYSLGCTLYQMLAGVPPFISKNIPELMMAHALTPPPKVREKRRDVPAALDEVLSKAMAKKPGDRFASAEEFMKGLAPFVKEKGKADSRREDAGNGLWIGLALAVVVVALGIAGYAFRDRLFAYQTSVVKSEPVPKTPTSDGGARVHSTTEPKVTPTAKADKEEEQRPKLGKAAAKKLDKDPRDAIRVWVGDFQRAHAEEWPTTSDLAKFVFERLGDNEASFGDRMTEIRAAVERETASRKENLFRPFDLLKPNALADEWSKSAAEAIRDILTVNSNPMDQKLSIKPQLLDEERAPLQKVKVGQSFDIVASVSEEVYVTCVRFDADGYFFAVSTPQKIPADKDYSITNGLKFESAGARRMYLYATDQPLIAGTVKPDPALVDATFPTLFTEKKAFERVYAGFEAAKPVAGLGSHGSVRRWTRVIVSIPVEP